MRSLLLVLLAGCAASPPPGPALPEPEPAVEPDSTSSCNIWFPDGQIEWTLDSLGRPLARYENSDAAGAQWSSRWVRDAEGRTLRIETEMLEGPGVESGEGHERRELSYRTDPDGSVVVSYERYGDTHQVRWTYDAQGRPVRREFTVDGEEPHVVACEYDDRGRPVRVGDWRYGYESERSVPSWAVTPEGTTVSVVGFGQTLFTTDPQASEPPEWDSRRFEGDCIDFFFEPCSPVFAPPIAGRPVSRLPAPSLEPLDSMEAVVASHLGCRATDDEENRCTVDRVERARTDAEGALREVAVVTIARGASGAMSTHLILRVRDGWWLGPQLGDGPFNGNQMVGTLRFRVSEVSLRSVDPELGPALLARYETETLHEIDEQEHAVTESGWILCLSPGTSQLRCARLPEQIEETIDGEATTASARLTFPGDGTIAIDQVTGSHDRVQTETFPVEWLYQ